MNYLNEFENNYDVEVDYRKCNVRAAFCQDRENTPGVYRLTDIVVEIEDIEGKEEQEEKIENELRNHFAVDEYFIEDPNWRKSAENKIKECIDKIKCEET